MNKDNSWKETGNFPAGKKQWAIMRSGNVYNSTLEDINASLKKWNPFGDVLFCSPSSERFLPPFLIPEISEKYHTITKRKFNVVIIMGLYLGLLSIVMSMFLNIEQSKSLKISALIFLVNVFIYSEYKYIISNRLAFGERFLFLAHLGNQSLLPKIVFSSMLIIGLVQLYLAYLLNNNDEVITKFGLYYPAIEKNEYWRFFIGPFFHSSIEHWIVNAAMLTMVSFLLFRESIGKSLAVIYIAIVISGCFSYVYSYLLKQNLNVDAFAGVSGGVFYVLGFSLWDSIVDKSNYPEKFWLSILSCALIAFLVPILTDSNTSNISHTAGAIVGLFVGMIQSFKRKS